MDAGTMAMGAIAMGGMRNIAKLLGKHVLEEWMNMYHIHSSFLLQYIMNRIEHLNIFILLLLLLFSCTNKGSMEKHQNNRDNIVTVKEEVKEIDMDDVIIGSVARLSIINNFLIINDSKSPDLLLHLFDCKNAGYKYISSAVPRGQGPGEIANIGHIGVNSKKNEIYVSDHGKLKIFLYPLDSIVRNPFYQPQIKKEINNIQFPSNYEYICDTLSFARIIEPTGNVGHNEILAKWNIESGDILKMKYSNPKVEKKRISIAVSIEDDILVEAYHNYDLMTILDLNGNLISNVYGKNWNSRNFKEINHYGKVIFIGKTIVASYSGGNRLTDEYYPTKLLLFDINGNYVKTIETGYRISDFCYDDKNNNIIFNFEDVIQFGYLNLDGILD
ncbi:6-bladed beta-propeller [Proteiniphilum propionicum]|jgi:hypothetical protein|uniref:6-bladed beta-propeller n=1 Tax=Proteiniphilum propionicum TaxID=2829812 RepID=UPI001EEC3DB2|nr:6-bladed beta-propeller [Proteiniphilum propionicum]